MMTSDYRTPSKELMHALMRKVNAFGTRPRILVELDKMVYVPGLKRKYEIINEINEERVVSVAAVAGSDISVQAVPPRMPLEKADKFGDLVITSRHRTLDPSRPTHLGLDIDLVTGDPVVSVWDGTVESAGLFGGYGNQVLIDHGNGIKTRYAHLSGVLVAKGNTVAAGQRIGLGGSTGDSTGSHLHFEVYKDGEDLNPEPVLKGEISLVTRGIPSSGGTATVVENVLVQAVAVKAFDRDFTITPQADDVFYDLQGAEFFQANVISMTAGFKTLFGFKDIDNSAVKSFKYSRQWDKDGILDFGYYTNFTAGDQRVRVKLDGEVVLDIRGASGAGDSGLVYPQPVSVSKGMHTFEISMTASDSANVVWGLTHIKAIEFDQVKYKTTGRRDHSLSDVIWSFQDDMDNAANWEAHGATLLESPAEHGFISFSSAAGKSNGFLRRGIVKFPMTIKANVQVSPECTGAQLLIGNGSVVFSPKLLPDRIEGNNGIGGGSISTYQVDNKIWQSYLFVIHNEAQMTVYHRTDGMWVNTDIIETPEPYTTDNMLLFLIDSPDSGTLYVDEVKYAFTDYSLPILNSGDPTLLEVGGFVYEQTFYLEDDIMNWEIAESADMASATASITLNNSKGLYSSEYSLTKFMQTAKRNNPMSYWEAGAMRHVISEGTPVRIYVGFGEHMVRRFTGKIKGEITEDSQERTLIFHCVDRYDFVDNTVLYKPLSYPPQDDYNGDGLVRPWITSSIVQSLAVKAGMTGWRYNAEDVLYPDLEIEDTYFIDIDMGTKEVMKFDPGGKLLAVEMESIRMPDGFKNPFVHMVTFKAGERLSDCISSLINDIGYRAYCDWYGTFKLKSITLENNHKWEFAEGENLISFSPTTDYSRIRNHLVIAGSRGLQYHFFDRELFVAAKGEIRTAAVSLPWIDESDGRTALGAKKVVADKLFFDMKRMARTRSLVIKGNPLVQIYDGAYIYDSNTSTVGNFIVKSNKLMGDQKGMINMIEVTWSESV